MNSQKTEPSTIPYMFYERINMLINASGKTCSELSKAWGISRSAIFAYKGGDTAPNATVLMRICEYFNVSADWLLGLSRDYKLHKNRKCVLDADN